jgi:hypothetical protein
MALLKQFAPPANVADLTDNDQTNLAQQWSDRVNGWTKEAISTGGDGGTQLDFYYNPLTTEAQNNPISKPVAWTAFPNRILLSFPNATFLEQMGYAEGVHEDGTFGPPPRADRDQHGPRGWQDEYCEWIATRDANGKISRVDFTCENRDYWSSLWQISPSRVLELYQQLVSPDVKLEDLYQTDHATGHRVYQPINKWNTQPSNRAVTGAVHLISRPNSLPAEISLAAQATVLRHDKNGQPVTDPDVLVKCSGYGVAGRNSDPHIGAEVNNVIIGGGLVASLQDPVGLYIQTPDFSGYSLPSDPKLPANANVSECWNIVRGHARRAGDNIDFILHARFEIPQRWKQAGVSFTVGDIQISGNAIKYGAQITQTFEIALRALALRTRLPPQEPQPCLFDRQTDVSARLAASMPSRASRSSV